MMQGMRNVSAGRAATARAPAAALAARRSRAACVRPCAAALNNQAVIKVRVQPCCAGMAQRRVCGLAVQTGAADSSSETADSPVRTLHQSGCEPLRQCSSCAGCARRGHRETSACVQKGHSTCAYLPMHPAGLWCWWRWLQCCQQHGQQRQLPGC